MYERIANILRNSKNTVVLTGAGVSTNSGLKDYRSEIDNDIYKGIKLSELCNIEQDKNDKNFISYYRDICNKVQSNKPNKAHDILEDWKSKRRINIILTQNIDGYHGKKNVLELHGNLDEFYCSDCKKRFSWKYYQNTNKCNNIDFKIDKGYISCKGILRPNTILFGEFPRHVKEALFHMYSSDVILIVGTSLSVSPVNLLPVMAKDRGAILIAINRNPITSIEKHIDYYIYGEDIVDVLSKINDYLIC